MQVRILCVIIFDNSKRGSFLSLKQKSVSILV